MNRILLSGGTGLIGKKLATYLSNAGYDVALLSRRNVNYYEGHKVIFWNPEELWIHEDALNYDIVINLAGENIADGQWTASRKRKLLSSRIDAIQTLINATSRPESKIKRIIHGSAIGYYPKNTTTAQSESHASGNDFLSYITENCEATLNGSSVPVSIVRIGIVLDADGGFLKSILPSFYLPLIPIPGNGTQMISWIAIDDLCSVFEWAIKNPEQCDVVNAIAPNPLMLNDLFKKLASRKFSKYFLFHIPPTLIKLILGEKACIVLDGQNISTKKLQDQNFNFQYNNFDHYIQHIYAR